MNNIPGKLAPVQFLYSERNKSFTIIFLDVEKSVLFNTIVCFKHSTTITIEHC